MATEGRGKAGVCNLMKRLNSDISLRRSSRKYSRQEQFARILWAFAQFAFLFIPRPLWGARVFILRLFGAKIGSSVRIYPSAKIHMPWNLTIENEVTIGDRVILYALGPIKIGARSTVSQGAHLCAGTHDFENAAFTLLKQPISIEENVWICADAFIGPNVRIAQGCVVGARAVVIKDLKEWSIVAGNPARFIRQREVSNRLHDND